MSGTEIETAISQEQRDEAIAEALTSGCSVRAVRKEFGLSQAELDAALERCWPIDLQRPERHLGGEDLGTQARAPRHERGCSD